MSVKLMAVLTFVGKKSETCATEVVPPVIVSARILFLTSAVVTDVEVIARAAERIELVAVPN